MLLEGTASRFTDESLGLNLHAEGRSFIKPQEADNSTVEPGLLVAGMAHEFKNAIGSSLIAAETALSLLNNLSADLPIMQCLNDIISGMDRCSRIAETVIRNLNSIVPRKQRHELVNVVKRAINAFLTENLCSEQNIQLCTNEHPIYVHCNDFELELALVNILRNGIQNGDNHTRISITTFTTPQFAVIQITDDGPGISGCSINNIFEPFYSTRINQRGTGLGLYIVKKIIHQSHQGHIRVESTPGSGTTFVIQLPL